MSGHPVHGRRNVAELLAAIDLIDSTDGDVDSNSAHSGKSDVETLPQRDPVLRRRPATGLEKTSGCHPDFHRRPKTNARRRHRRRAKNGRHRDLYRPRPHHVHRAEPMHRLPTVQTAFPALQRTR